MNFKTEIDSGFVEGVKNGEPSLGKLLEGGLDEAGRALRPGIDIRPSERARKRDVGFQSEMSGGAGRETQLLDGPSLAGFTIAMEVLWREAVEHRVVGRMASDELSLKVRGKLGDGEFVLRSYRGKFIAVRFAFGGALQIEKPGIPRRDLHSDVAEMRGPGANRIE